MVPAPRRVPESFLRAEIAAFPLTSEASFQRCLLRLDPRMPDGDATSQLWQACEHQYTQHTGWSLDRLVSARDRGWFGLQHQSTPLPLHLYLSQLARSHLMPIAGVTHVEQSTDLTGLDALDHYHWLTTILPEDLLLSGLGVHPAPLRVDLDPPLLIQRLMDSGIAEIHQHVGAGMDFPMLWASALAAIVNSNVPESRFRSPGAPFQDGSNLLRWLLAAGIARCCLAEFLSCRRSEHFEAFTHKVSSIQSSAGWAPFRRTTLITALQALNTGKEDRLPPLEPLRSLYEDLHPSAFRLDQKPVDSIEELFQRCDPVADRFDLVGDNAGERWLMDKGLNYLQSFDWSESDQIDLAFERVFWQTIKVRCQFFRTVVERPLTAGLQWFIRFYNRIGPLSAPIGPILPQASYRVSGQNSRLRSLELRTHPDSSSIGIGEQVHWLLQSWQRLLQQEFSKGFEPEFGVVFHFIKERDQSHHWHEGRPPAFASQTHAEPDKGLFDVSRGRFRSYFEHQAQVARELANFITTLPACLWVIRGLDVASDELAVPTWVLVPLFRHVLDQAAQASVLPGAGPPLRVTAHVGEDFRHLSEGLRRIYEHIHYVMGPSPGRLGHAIALGLDPQAWAESVGTILMPAEERLWDLVWEWRLYTQYHIRPEYRAIAPPGRVDVVLNQVRALAELIYPNDNYSIEHLAEAHHLLHRFTVHPYNQQALLSFNCYPFTYSLESLKANTGGRLSDRVARLLRDFLNEESVFLRGQTPIDIPIQADEVASLRALQDALRRGIGRQGIVIEVNPSSNLFIGDLLDLRHHPILRLFPPIQEPDDPAPIPIALGSDDPLTFGTRLVREYTLLHQTARAAGYSERDTHNWLEAIRQTSMDARFTLRWTPNATEKIADLLRQLEQYLHLPPASMRC